MSMVSTKLVIGFSVFILLCITESSLVHSSGILSLNCESIDETVLKYCTWNVTNPTHWHYLGYNASKVRNIQWDGAEHGPSIYVDAIQLYEPGSNWVSSPDELISPLIDAKSMDVPWCYTFHYYIHGEGVGNLSLKMLQGGQEQTVWTRVGQAGDMWHNQAFEIVPQNQDFQLKLEATPRSGAIALATSKVYSYGCSSRECSFESNECNRTWGWTNSWTGNGTDYFKLTQIQAKSSASSIKQDHTTESEFGHFLESHGGNQGDTSAMYSPLFQPLDSDMFPDEHCMKFWYRFENSSMASLQVFVQDGDKFESLWTSSKDLPSKMWHQGAAHFSNSKTETKTKQFVIEAKNLGGENALVQIDDILLTADDGSTCSEKISCNFDEDMCGWTRDASEEFKWEHGIGRVSNAKVLPSNVSVAPLDVTEQKWSSPHQQGMYMYTDFTMKNDTEKSTVIMYSQFRDMFFSDSYLNFQYIPLVFNDQRNKLSVNMLDVEGNVIDTIFSIGATQPSSKWTFERVRVPFTQKLFRFAFQVETYSPQTYLAIDEIHLL